MHVLPGVVFVSNHGHFGVKDAAEDGGNFSTHGVSFVLWVESGTIARRLMLGKVKNACWVRFSRLMAVGMVFIASIGVCRGDLWRG